MTQIINAIYEEGVLKPLEPLNMQEHTKVRLIIEPEKESGEKIEKTIELLLPESHRPYQNIVAEIRQRQLSRGHKSPTREDIDSYLQAERDSWEKKL